VTPEPIAVGLHLCRDLTVHADTLEVSLTRIFRTLRSQLYPAFAPRFWAFASVYGPEAQGNLYAAIYRVSNGDLVYVNEHLIRFPDRFTPIYYRLQLSSCRFPAVGAYEMLLMVDRDVVAQSVFHVLTEEGEA
jgi:hypothetical protein